MLCATLLNVAYFFFFLVEIHLFCSAKIILGLFSLVSETKSSSCTDFRCFALNPIFLINLIIFIDVAEFIVLSTAYISLQLLDLSFQFQMSKTQSKLYQRKWKYIKSYAKKAQGFHWLQALLYPQLKNSFFSNNLLALSFSSVFINELWMKCIVSLQCTRLVIIILKLIFMVLGYILAWSTW